MPRSCSKDFVNEFDQCKNSIDPKAQVIPPRKGVYSSSVMSFQTIKQVFGWQIEIGIQQSYKDQSRIKHEVKTEHKSVGNEIKAINRSCTDCRS